jgi:hypothetical protein
MLWALYTLVCFVHFVLGNEPSVTFTQVESRDMPQLHSLSLVTHNFDPLSTFGAVAYFNTSDHFFYQVHISRQLQVSLGLDVKFKITITGQHCPFNSQSHYSADNTTVSCPSLNHTQWGGPVPWAKRFTLVHLSFTNYTKATFDTVLASHSHEPRRVWQWRFKPVYRIQTVFDKDCPKVGELKLDFTTFDPLRDLAHVPFVQAREPFFNFNVSQPDDTADIEISFTNTPAKRRVGFFKKRPADAPSPLYAHSLVLSRVSDYFDAIVSRPWECPRNSTSNRMIMSSAPFKQKLFKHFLVWIYQGASLERNYTLTDISRLVTLADYYQSSSFKTYVLLELLSASLQHGHHATKSLRKLLMSRQPFDKFILNGLDVVEKMPKQDRLNTFKQLRSHYEIPLIAWVANAAVVFVPAVLFFLIL